MSDVPALGLLLDVDGPVASPVTRSIAIPSIATDIVALANAGVPVVFNTGRSDQFLKDEVVGPLVEGGLLPHARVFGVCEKGGSWFRITPTGAGDLSIDESLFPYPDLVTAVDDLVTERFADTVFFDRTKRTMIAVEQRLDVASDDYLAQQSVIDRAVIDLCTESGLGTMWRNERHPAPDGSISIRLDPSIISTDIESVRVGKDFGAERALTLVAASGPVPAVWRTMGDSRVDYAMADWLHAADYEIAHVDVRPADGVPEKPYPVLTAAAALTNDAAGAVFLRRWASRIVEGTAPDDHPA
ncbi:MAG: hypothetical protein EPO52_06350 [Herbiconiux sp.]|uniref:hypothetical protein n=1 Tax=Herbiconiux sp. TaxID=1871186 RepID=UPI00120F5DB1|nr:hypothetical protein [Herbiconiux sp.]TAJ47826.1 MAG: hypothetical protein EPO52_06350 [Herbiconiux sp.]